MDINKEIDRLDVEITDLISDFSIEHFLPNVGDDELEIIVAKAIKFGMLVAERDSAQAKAVPAQLDVNSILHDIDCYFDNGLSNTERTANNLLQSIYEKLSGEVKAQEPAND